VADVRGDSVAPNAPSALSGTAAFRTVFLQWTNSANTDLVATEVWASNTNDRATAALIGEPAAPPQRWLETPIGSNTTRYDWIRHRDKDGLLGPFHPSGATSGVAVTTLTATLTNSEIAVGTILADRINVGPLEFAALASKFGGPIPSTMHDDGTAVPVSNLFRVRIEDCRGVESTLRELTGIAVLGGVRASLAGRTLRAILAALQREATLQ